ncbi:MAG TPA: hypothetical protein VGY48_00855 [Vicinamibacterales bacterium]|nr:hypothetical protein [Vicinamibacterales bacterium]
MNRSRLTLAALLFLAAGPINAARAQTTIDGDWEVTIQAQQGNSTVLVTFKQDGSKVSGIFKSPLGEMPFQDGTLSGSDLKFTFSIPIQGQALDVTMTGKVEAASITGKAQFGGFGEGDWTAKRVDSAAAAAAARPAPAAAPAAAGAGSTASATGLSGKWDVTLKTQMGDLPVSAELAESAGKVTGSLVGPMGPVDVTGTFEGNAIKLDFTAKTPQGDIPISMSGELNGDAIVNGKAEVGGMGQAEWTAKRKQ